MKVSKCTRGPSRSLWAIIGRSLPCFVRRWIGRIGCALFSSNWYCLAHGRKEGRKEGGHAGPRGSRHRHAYSAAAAAAVVSLAISPQPLASRPGQSATQPAARWRWPKSQVEKGERERYQHQMRTAGRQRRRKPFFLSGHSLRVAQSERPLFSRNLI